MIYSRARSVVRSFRTGLYVSELYLYSRKDFYLPYKYLEDVVLANKGKLGKII
jgi:hypothetical protein